MRRRVISFLIVFRIISEAAGQGLPVAGFLEDSLSPGQLVHYYISYTHPEQQVVVFPDSLPADSPFMLEEKIWTPTKTTNGVSTDSAVFILRTFEVKDTLSLAFPVYVYDSQKRAALYPEPALIYFRRLLPHDSLDKLSVLSDTELKQLNAGFNYPMFFLVSGLSVILLIVAGAVFGKPLVRYYRQFIMIRMHKRFVAEFDLLAREFKKRKTTDALEEAISSWKKYLSKLDQNGLETYTTTEISDHYQNEDLKKALKGVDRAIYGGFINEEAGKSLKVLKKFSSKRFVIQKNRVGKHV